MSAPQKANNPKPVSKRQHTGKPSGNAHQRRIARRKLLPRKIKTEEQR